GFLCLLLFGFGWARPVPVNISNFKNRRAGMALTALAGPLANFIIAFIAFCVYIPLLPYQSYAYGGGNAVLYVIGQFVMIVGSMSVGLGVFNLIPVHPLDGSRVLDAVMPFSWSLRLQKYQAAFVAIFAVALWMGWLDGLMSMAINFELRLALRFLSIFI
ncbi:MAG: site-2 protease family protein, partial [Agathobaculum sp.]|uniref:site-2 protease family protein n=1 Tax=Agathobaculum sp. TaxID=2048138 RepID=UPI003D8BC835